MIAACHLRLVVTQAFAVAPSWQRSLGRSARWQLANEGLRHRLKWFEGDAEAPGHRRNDCTKARRPK
jgi:hypothetical protein